MKEEILNDADCDGYPTQSPDQLGFNNVSQAPGHAVLGVNVQPETVPASPLVQPFAQLQHLPIPQPNMDLTLHNNTSNLAPPGIVNESYDGGEIFIVGICTVLSICLFPLWFLSGIKVVREYERAVIFRLGRIMSANASGPGLVLILPCIDEVRPIDKRTFFIDVPEQEILTKDNVSIRVNGVVFFRVFNAIASVKNVEDFRRSTAMMAQTALRNTLGEYSLTGLLLEREQIAQDLKLRLDGVTDKWGIDVERVTIKDVQLPYDLQRAMATEAEAKQSAKAKLIKSEGEREAAENLRIAADELARSGSTLQLRYLQTINQISRNNATIVMPFPTEFLQ